MKEEDNLHQLYSQLVEIPFNAVYWNIQAQEIEAFKTHKKLVKLEWGWGAGMTDKEREENEEDGQPTDWAFVVTTPRMAAMLVSKLQQIPSVIEEIEKTEQRSKEDDNE